jgi:hypothetical protein
MSFVAAVVVLALGACAESGPRSAPAASPSSQTTTTGASTDRVSCLESCHGYDDTVPLGSRCLSQYADCSLKCEEKFYRGP